MTTGKIDSKNPKLLNGTSNVDERKRNLVTKYIKVGTTT